MLLRFNNIKNSLKIFIIMLSLLFATMGSNKISPNPIIQIEISEPKERATYFQINNAAEIESYFANPIWKKSDIIGSIVSSPFICDLDNNTDMEIIILSDRGLVYILDHLGNYLINWGDPYPKAIEEQLASVSGVAPHPILVDFNDDGEQEILVATFNGTIHAWFLNGTEVDNWPIRLDNYITSSPAIGDIDGDLKNEIIIGCWDDNLYAFELNGSIVPGFPFTGANGDIIGTPALANLDNDTEFEIIFGSYDYSIYVIDGNGTLLPGWPVSTGHHVKSSPAIADIDNNSQNEIIIGSVDSYLYILRNNGTNFGGWPWQAPTSIYGNPTISDINYDGFIDLIIQPNRTVFTFTDLKNSTDYAWTDNFPDVLYDEHIIVNIDNDDYPEIIQVTQTGRIRILSNNGSMLYLKDLSLKGISSPPAVGDIDGDKYIEVVFTTKGTDVITSVADVYVFKMGSFGLLPWPGYRGGRERIGMPFDNEKDGLSDLEEELIGSNSSLKDSDGDGLTDGREIYNYCLNPTITDVDMDSDGDGLTNVDEVDLYGTNPIDPDSDDDMLTDGQEILIYATNPLSPDTDNDFLPDDFEVKYHNTNPLIPDTYDDLDLDNFTNFEEFEHDTNPDDPDTDKDGLKDGDEVKKYHTIPTIADADRDSDGDGLTNVDEVDLYGTNPIDSDTDGDGYTDYQEILRGSDPNDPKSKPYPLWTIAPISLGSVVVLSVIGYFTLKKIILKKRKTI